MKLRQPQGTRHNEALFLLHSYIYIYSRTLLACLVFWRPPSTRFSDESRRTRGRSFYVEQKLQRRFLSRVVVARARAGWVNEKTNIVLLPERISDCTHAAKMTFPRFQRNELLDRILLCPRVSVP